MTAPLQWGRDLVIAEMPAPPFTPAPLRELQWGRDLVIAEILYGARVKAMPQGFNGAAIW